MRSPLPPVLIALVVATGTQRPAPPQEEATGGGPDIYLAPLAVRGEELTIGHPLDITPRPGYDDQPSFTPDGGSILYASVLGDGQADIFRYDIRAKISRRITRTPESEYSPVVMPGGFGISAVRVERDSTQRLWRFALDGSNPAPLLEDVKKVGYYAWADDHTVVLYLLGPPPVLARADPATEQVLPVLENPGRSIPPIPGDRAVSFIRKRQPGESWVMRYDLTTGNFTPLVRTLPGVEDHAWTPDGILLAAHDNRVYAWRANWGGWRQVATFPDPAMARITRIAVSPHGDWIALVAEPAPAP